jgi:predicted DNA-binding antitoxin AbrB/MazE fold protein
VVAPFRIVALGLGLLVQVKYNHRRMKTSNGMKEFRTSLTIKDPKQVVLSDLPFSEGQEVEVVVIAKDEMDARVQQLKDLLKATQALPQSQALSEEDIIREVEAYRNGR